MLTSSIIIQASKDAIWEILLDKVFHPKKYIPGVLEFDIEERSENEYIRTLCTETDDVVELIIIDKEHYAITSSLVRHMFLKGKLHQKIEEVEEGIKLSFEQEREITLPELQMLDMQPALDDAVQQIKETVEKKED